VVQNSQDHLLGEDSGTVYTAKKFLIVTEIFATVLVYKAQENKANIMQCTAVKPVHLTLYNTLTAKDLLQGSCKSTIFFQRKQKIQYFVS
jgi:hypothetical protein